MNFDLKNIIWAEFGVIILTLGLIHNIILNNAYDSISIPFCKLSISLLITKFLYKV